ncbi:DUF5134 domain-containing protein [Streptomyces sp. WAC 06738]|uniref:DUF5134 domain-containing protein n=1 Tax=Streptomyces sp. WAC 06738 TaxID=2203210 RepID=UPI000F6B7149|nr:DUF5134 domain-containing protein [Streptomyces sp. WAC 06738]AZM44756.1 DUF5134 domain-containing protein [Streptomyces sp. WAC 06738]
MHGPPLAGLLLTALCAGVAGLCLLRMRAVAAEERRGAAGDALMGLGMAAMALPAGLPGPAAWTAGAFATVFGAAFVRAVLPLRAAGHHLHHAIGALAMVYMAVAMGAADHGGHGAAAGLPAVTAGLLAYYVLYVLYGGLRPVAAGAGGPRGPVPAGAGAGGGWAGRPELAGACRVCMGAGMVAMLLAL